MDKAELQKISNALSERLGRDIALVAAEPLEGGFQSEAFKLTDKSGAMFFLKRMRKEGPAGFDILERHLYSSLVSHSMSARASQKPASIGIIIAAEDDTVFLPIVGESASIYHVQEFAELGENYWSLLSKRKKKKNFDEADEEEIKAIVQCIARVHGGSRPSGTEAQALYKDSLHSLLAYHGYFFRCLSDFGPRHPFLPRAKHGEYIGHILNLIYEWEGGSDRLRPLHGDFWGTNIFLDSKGNARAIDFSRIPYGEPGIDIGYFMAQYLWFYHDTGNPYFKKFGEAFLKAYEKAMGDKEIRKTLVLPLGLLALLYCNPRFHPDNSRTSEKKFFAAVLVCIKKGRFVWEG